MVWSGRSALLPASGAHRLYWGWSSPCTGQDSACGFKQEHEISLQGPVVDIGQVQLHPLIKFFQEPVGIRDHGPEFQYIELSAIAAQAYLAVKDRSGEALQ